jgi:hypothetical protein
MLRSALDSLLTAYQYPKQAIAKLRSHDNPKEKLQDRVIARRLGRRSNLDLKNGPKIFNLFLTVYDNSLCYA